MGARQGLTLAALIVIYTAWSLIAWGFQPALETFDSYRYSGDWGLSTTEIFNPLNGGFATSLLYVLAPEPTLISLIQVLIAVFAWSALAIAIVHRLAGHWVGWTLAIMILAISGQSILWSTHFALAAESLTFSATVIWLAAVIWLTSRSGSSALPVIGTIAAMALIAATRPQAMLALIPIQFVVLVWWTRREHQPKALLYATPALLAIAAFSLYRVWQVSQHDRWPFRYALHNLVDKGPSFREYALERMPQCDALLSALGGPNPWNDILALDNTMISACPETYLWFQSGAPSVWNWVPAIPGAALRNFADVLPTIALIRWNEITNWPTTIDAAIIPGDNPLLFTLAALVLGILLAWFAGVRPQITWLGVSGTLIVIGSSVGYVFLVWAADGVDLGRHVFPILPLLGVAALVMPSVVPPRTRKESASAA